MIQTFKCVWCGKTAKRNVKRRKAWHRSYCMETGKTVRLQAVRPV